MRLLVCWRDSDGKPGCESFHSLGALRNYVRHLAGPVVADVEIDGGEPFPTARALDLLGAVAGDAPQVTVTQRLLLHLPRVTRQGALPLRAPEDPVGDVLFFRISGWPDARTAHDPGSLRERRSVDRLLALGAEDLETTLPGPVVARLRDGTFHSLRDLISATESELQAAGLGGLSRSRLRRWFRRFTHRLGAAVTISRARELLDPRREEEEGGMTVRPNPAVNGDLQIPELIAAMPDEVRQRDATSLPSLSTRAVRALRRHNISRVGDLAGLTEAQMLGWPNFGQGSLDSLRAGLRLVAVEGGRLPQTPALSPGVSGQTQGAKGMTVSSLAEALPQAARELRIERIPGAGARVVHVLPEHGILTISGLVGVPDERLMELSNFGPSSFESLRSGLARLRDDIGRCPAGALATVGTLAHALVAQSPLLVQVQARLASLDARESRIASARMFADGEVLPLRALADEMGVSRERIRQLEGSVCKHLDPHGDLGRMCDERLAAIRSLRSTPLLVAEVESMDPWFSGAASSPRLLGQVLSALECQHAALQWDSLPPFVSLRSCSDMDELRSAFRAGLGAAGACADLGAAVRAFLQERRVPELGSAFLERLGPYVRGDAGIVFEPRLLQRIEAVLASAQGPLRVDEIEDRLRKAGIPFAGRAVRGSLDRIDAINTGPSEYILASKLAPWLEYRDRVFADITPLMDSSPDREWSTRDLLVSLQDAGHTWAEAMPVHVIDYLLRQDPERFRRLGRGMWCSARSIARDRRNVVGICVDILRKAGVPLSREELASRLRQTRSIRFGVTILWPLVVLPDGCIGLGPRDLGLPEDAWEQMQRWIRHKLASVGRIDAGELRELVREHASAQLSIRPDILARALRGGSRVLLDGDGLGDGLRRHDVERRGSPIGEDYDDGDFEVIGSSEDSEGQARGGTEKDAFAGLEEGMTLDQISGRMGRAVPPASLRMKLLIAGWQSDPSGRWTRAPRE